jgi:hypothetical protein
MFYSCSNTNPEVKVREHDVYSFKSDTGNILEITLPGEEIFSFEKTTLSIRVSYNQDVTPRFPDWSELGEELNILNVQDVLGPIEEKGIVTRVQEVTIGQLLPGEYYINPFSIRFFAKNVLVDEIHSDPIPLKIISSLIKGENDIIDTLDMIQTVNPNWIRILLIVFPIILLLCGLLYFLHKRKIRNTINSFDNPIKNYVSIINEADINDVKLLYKLLNNTLKEFLDNSLFLSVQSQTTEEFIDYSMVTPIIEEWLKKQLYDFLKRSDEISFGNRIPDKERIEGDKKFCLDFIDYINKKIIEGVSL